MSKELTEAEVSGTLTFKIRNSECSQILTALMTTDCLQSFTEERPEAKDAFSSDMKL